jgi:PAS domain S-box-containing protein
MTARAWAEPFDREADLSLLDLVPALTRVAGPGGECVFANRRWREFTGRAPGDEAGDGWAKDIHPDDAPGVAAAIVDCEASGRYEVEYRLRHHTGEYRWLLETGECRFDDEHAYAGYLATAVDVTERREAEARARIHQQLVDSVGQAVIATDLAGTVIGWNRQAESLYGWPAGEAIGRNVNDLTVPDTGRAQADAIIAALRAGEQWSGEFLVQRRDGSRFPARVTNAPVLADDGQLVAIIGVSEDISEQKRLEEALRASEQELRGFFENAPIGILWLDGEGAILRANAAQLEMLGYTGEELAGRSFAGLLADKRAARRLLAELRDAKTVANRPATLRHRDGSVRDVVLSGNALVAGRRMAQVRLLIRDVTEMTRAEETLRQSEARLSGIIASAMDAIITVDESQVIQFFNRGAESVFRVTSAGAIGRPLADLLPERFHAAHEAHVRAFGESGVSARQMSPREILGRRADGSEFPAEARISQVAIDGHRLFTVILRDITERKAVEKALAESEARYRALVNLVPANITTTSVDGAIEYVNEHWAEYTGLDLAQTRTWRAGGVMHPDDLARADANFRRARATGEPFQDEIRLRRADGEYRWHMYWTEPSRQPDGSITGWVAVSIDIDDRKQIEESLRRSEERLRLAQVAARMGTWEWDILRNTVMWSEEMERLYGLEPGRFGGTLEAYLGLVHAEDRADVEQSIQALLREGHRDLEHRVVRGDGSLRWLSDRARLFYDDQGTGIRAIGVGIDITERKEFEQELARANAVKDEFLGLVSHELKTPLTTVVGLASILSRRMDTLDATTRAEAAEQLFRDAERLQALIENMLVLARLERTPLEPEPILLQHLVPNAVALHKRRHPQREIRTHIPVDLPPVEAQATWVEQVLHNLLGNAEKYTPREAPVTVEVAVGDGFVEVRVVDEGEGIDQDEAEAIFRPFYRSARNRDTAHGAGLGLAVCKRLVELQGGSVRAARRADGPGTVIAFTLPVVDLEGA